MPRDKKQVAPHRKDWEYVSPKSELVGLAAHCEGCKHPREGKCPYWVEPKRAKLPCFFKHNVDRTAPLDIPVKEHVPGGKKPKKKMFGEMSP